MQLIDLSDVHDFSAARFLLYWLIASVVAIIVAYSIGQENKLKWWTAAQPCCPCTPPTTFSPRPMPTKPTWLTKHSLKVNKKQ